MDMVSLLSLGLSDCNNDNGDYDDNFDNSCNCNDNNGMIIVS